MSDKPVEQVTEQLQKTYLDEVTGEQVSKSELKKRQKAREVAKKKAEKAAKNPAPVASKKAKEEELTPNQYFEIRSRQINELRTTKNPNPYPHKFHVSIRIDKFIEKYAHLKRGDELKDEKVSIAGRIFTKRESGTQLKFYVLHGEGKQVQVVAQAFGEEQLDSVHDLLRRGDIIGVTGYPFRTAPKKGGEGELSVFVESVQLLDPLPAHAPY